MTQSATLRFELSVNEGRDLLDLLRSCEHTHPSPRLGAGHALSSMKRFELRTLIEYQILGDPIEGVREAIKKVIQEDAAKRAAFENLRQSKEEAWLALPWYKRQFTKRVTQRSYDELRGTK